MPPPRARTLFVVGILAAVIAGAVVLRRDDPVRLDARASDPAPASASDRLAVPRPAAGSGAPVPAAIGRGTVSGVVRRGGKEVAARVLAWVEGVAVPGESLGWAAREARPWIPPPAPRAPDATATADGEGRFALTVPAPTVVRVQAIDAAGAHATTFAHLPRAGDLADVRLDLGVGGATLEGRVRHADGTPFRGAVLVHRPDVDALEGLVGGATSTDATGRFRATGLSPGPHVVTAYEPGRFAATSHPLAVPRSEGFVFVLDVDVHEGTGRVVDATTEAGIPGAEVTARCNDGGGRSRYVARTRADGEGRFSLRVPRGYAQWTVDASDRPTDVRWLTSLDPTRPVELRVERGVPLVGRVLRDDDGSPVAGIPVFAQRTYVDREASTTSDAEGRFTFPSLPRGGISVVAHGHGLTTRDVLTANRAHDPFLVRVEPGVSEVVRRVVPTAGIRGRVLDPRGAPVPHATVRVWPEDTSRDSLWLYSLASLSDTVAAADGTFRAADLLPGVLYDLTARDGGGRAGSAVGAASADAGAFAEVRLVDGPVIEVRCATPAGEPVGGVGVSANGPGADATTTDGDGVARLGPIAPGRVTVHVEAPDAYTVVGDDDTEIDTSGGVVTAAFVLRPQRAIVGRVRWKDGSPASEAYVTSTPPGAAEDDDRAQTSGVDTAGTFHLEDVGDGEVELRVFVRGADEPLHTATAAADGEVLDLRLPVDAPPRTSIRVTAPDGRAVGATATLHVGPQGRLVPRSVRLEDGEGSTALLDGETWLRVVPWPSEMGRAGPITSGPFAPGTREVSVILPRPSEIAGRVENPDGRGREGVRVSVGPETLGHDFAAWSGYERRTATTDAEGRFRFPGLGAGDHLVDVSPPAGFDAPRGLRVAAGRTDLVVVLARAESIELRIVDPAGRGVVGASVFLRPGDGRQLRATSEGDGRATLVGVRATSGAAEPLRVDPPANRPDLAGLGLDRWRPAPGDLVLPAARPLRGVVNDTEGRPVVADVEHGLDSSRFPPIRSAADGTFSIPHLGEGVVGLRARTGAPVQRSARVEVPAGTTDVVLVVERTVALRVVLEGAFEAVVDSDDDATWVRVTETGGAWTESSSTNGGREGTVEGLRPSATYTVDAIVERQGQPRRVARIADVQGSIGRVVLPVVGTGSVRGTVHRPAGASRVVVRAYDGSEAEEATVDRDGAFRFPELGPWAWRVRASALVDGVWWNADADVEVRSGGEVVLDLRPAK